MPDLTLERELASEFGGPIAGLDEVGRGPWAGPVVACAVLLPDALAGQGGLPGGVYHRLDDSKKLSTRQRDALFDPLSDAIAHGIGIATVAEIDALNILQASLLAMRRALVALPQRPGAALVDGNRDPGLGIPTRLVVKGDSQCIAVAAASILAKVTRDRMMVDLAHRNPGYGWERNMGYGTRAHSEGLKNLGVTEHHRKSFAPVRLALESQSTC